jgi:hypothetical protein
MSGGAREQGGEQVNDIGAEDDGVTEFDPLHDEYVVFEESTLRAGAHLMVTHGDLYAGCSTGHEIVARIQELDDSGALEPLKTMYRATP